jgi:hypothetical protein
VHAYAPAEAGVFGISNSREWLYIGESTNIREALLAELGKTEERGTGFVFEVCVPTTRFARQDRLITEYQPALNRREHRRRE